MSRTPRRPAMSTSFPTSIMCATRSSSITSRTGMSTRRRPRKKPAKAPKRCRSNSTGRSNITIANYHGYRVTRSRAPFAAAVRLYNSGDIHFRNVHVNAESGYAICDDNGCGTFLRASKFPYENAIQDVTHHLEVREREFAVLDIPANPPTPAPADAPPFSRPASKSRSWKTDSFRSPARRWMPRASSTSSITTSSASMAGRRPKA